MLLKGTDTLAGPQSCTRPSIRSMGAWLFLRCITPPLIRATITKAADTLSVIYAQLRHASGSCIALSSGITATPASPSVYSTAASFDANRIKRCPFSERLFSYFPTSDALFDNRKGLSDALLLLGELPFNMLWIQTGGAPDSSTGGVEASFSGPVRGCII